EFPNVADQHLITPLAASKGWKPWEDHSTDHGKDQAFHGTCAAGKAVGQQYGVAKNAKLVVVAFANEDDDMISGFEEIYKDLKAHPERQKHSVVTMSMVSGRYDPKQDYTRFRQVLYGIMAMDVPIVVGAGNEGDDHNRRKIDNVPAIFAVQDRGFPLIVVGSVDKDGQRSAWSQLGENTNAVGQDITCLEDDPSQPTTGIRGTSFTTPQVAGQIANWLAMDKVPFDTTSPYLVGNVRDYLESDAAGWVRSGDSRVLWNGVTEADNPQIPVKRCWGLLRDGDTYMYLERDVLASLIKDKFCDEAVGKGASYGAEYHQGTLNHVKISIVYTDTTRPRSKD
ncbi:peptidase S8/S53 domain-containing protein, partial [Coniochaeta sp. 2T2.1]